MPTRRDVALGLPASALLAALPGVAAAQDTFTQDEIVAAASDALDSTAGAVAAAVERIFRENGRPVGYVQGEEGSGAWGFGLRYGQGLLFLKSGERADVFWQGPSFGWDFGGNASKVFTLVYGMTNSSQIYRRFPGVEGSAYFIGGIGVNYQRAEDLTLAPMRAGVGLRGGANVGYLAYSRKRRINPF
ncbi:MAG: EipA family protein [Hyphomonadaceae bacterium]|nr:EipA family protein [Hyphomonadaceae bacterium]